MKTYSRAFSALALGLTLAACSSSTQKPAEVAEPEEAPASEPEPSGKPGDDPRQSDINISDAIKKACGLTETEAHFAYNSAKLRESEKGILKKLADCFTTGPLKGRVMQLVGHADPRGEDEYNMLLGGRRADNVATALSSVGLPENQVTTTSRGEMDASGTDEASWSKDRRVDIMLKEEG